VKLFSSIHPSHHPFVSSSIHVWHHKEKKTLTEINNPPPPPSAHVSLSRKGMLSPRGGTPKILIYQYHHQFPVQVAFGGIFAISGLLPWSAVCCYLTDHKQAVQTSRFSVARVPMNTCEMWYIERFWNCSCS
jgi:hypothetical protein